LKHRSFAYFPFQIGHEIEVFLLYYNEKANSYDMVAVQFCSVIVHPTVVFLVPIRMSRKKTMTTETNTSGGKAMFKILRNT
jgi:hypothetical protein